MMANYPPTVEGTKVCTKCGEEKHVTEFRPEHRNRDGRCSWCRECTRAKDRTRQFSEGEREKRRERERQRYWVDPEAKRQAKREFRAADLEATRLTWRRWNQAARAFAADAEYVEHVDSLVILEMDDGVCGICGEDVDPFDFHVDHIVPLSAGGEHSYANSQVAHPACNRSKGNQILEAA